MQHSRGFAALQNSKISIVIPKDGSYRIPVEKPVDEVVTDEAVVHIIENELENLKTRSFIFQGELLHFYLIVRPQGMRFNRTNDMGVDDEDDEFNYVRTYKEIEAREKEEERGVFDNINFQVRISKSKKRNVTTDETSPSLIDSSLLSASGIVEKFPKHCAHQNRAIAESMEEQNIEQSHSPLQVLHKPTFILPDGTVIYSLSTRVAIREKYLSKDVELSVMLSSTFFSSFADSQFNQTFNTSYFESRPLLRQVTLPCRVQLPIKISLTQKELGRKHLINAIIENTDDELPVVITKVTFQISKLLDSNETEEEISPPQVEISSQSSPSQVLHSASSTPQEENKTHPLLSPTSVRKPVEAEQRATRHLSIPLSQLKLFPSSGPSSSTLSEESKNPLGSSGSFTMTIARQTSTTKLWNYAPSITMNAVPSFTSSSVPTQQDGNEAIIIRSNNDLPVTIEPKEQYSTVISLEVEDRTLATRKVFPSFVEGFLVAQWQVTDFLHGSISSLHTIMNDVSPPRDLLLTAECSSNSIQLSQPFSVLFLLTNIDVPRDLELLINPADDEIETMKNEFYPPEKIVVEKKLPPLGADYNPDDYDDVDDEHKIPAKYLSKLSDPLIALEKHVQIGKINTNETLQFQAKFMARKEGFLNMPKFFFFDRTAKVGYVAEDVFTVCAIVNK